MSASLPSEKPKKIQQFLHALLKRQCITVNQAVSSLGETCLLCHWICKHLPLCHVIQSDMLNVYHSPAHFFLFTLLFQYSVSSRGYLNCRRVWSLYNILFLQCLSLPMLFTIIGPFIFRVLDFLSGSMVKVHIAFFKNSRMLPSCCVKWHFSFPPWCLPYIWTIILLKLIYIIKVVQHLLSRLACHILNLAKKHGITLIPAYKPTHLNVEAISQGEGWCQGGTCLLT